MTKKLMGYKLSDILLFLFITGGMVGVILTLNHTGNPYRDVDSSSHCIIKNDQGEVLYDLPEVKEYMEGMKNTNIVYQDDNGVMRHLTLSGTYTIERLPETTSSLPVF